MLTWCVTELFALPSDHSVLSHGEVNTVFLFVSFGEVNSLVLNSQTNNV